MILSPRSLVYASHALQSLLHRAVEPLCLHLITDSVEDKELLRKEIAGYGNSHDCRIFAKSDLDDHEAGMFGAYPHLRRFRNGHPCWRKITDPLLLSTGLSTGQDEIVLLDPDLYFPNRFCFEPTPERGLLLMWQKPNCLLPAEIVDRALRRNIPLAHHVDIGVAHWRAGVDLEWLDWLLGQLGLEEHPNARFSMHVEAIVWAAVALRMGGGYLAPEQWHCWHRSQRIRLLRKLGVPGAQLLRSEPFARMKCFHAGGEAKYWLLEAKRRGWLDCDKTLDKPGTVVPFTELTPATYRREQAVKSCLRKFGYYSLFPSGALQ